MSDPLQRAVSRTLWLVVAPPLVAFVWQLARGLHGQRAADDPWPRRLGAGSSLLSAAALLGHEFALVRAAKGTVALVEPAVGGARFGALEFGFALALDRLSAAACTLACVVALAAAAKMVVRRGDLQPWRSWAWLELSLAGGLLSFLAAGLAAAWLGWALAAGASAWLAGWTDTKSGALRATRGALAAFALLVGGALLSGAVGGSSDPAPLLLDAHAAGVALAALLVAAVAMSAPPMQSDVPPELAALDRGAVAGLLGPFLLLRVVPLVPRTPDAAPDAATMIAVTGAALLVFAVRRARANPAGLTRWIAVAGGAPAGLTLIALGVDGAQGGTLVLLSSGFVAALLLGIADAAPGPPLAAARRPSVERALLGHAPEAGATLLMAFERWVVDAIAGSVGVVVPALAWALVRFDTHVVGAPVDVLAGRAVRLGRRVEPLVGGSLARIVWALVGAAGLAALVHALWPVR
jgi:hypothetical protein